MFSISGEAVLERVSCVIYCWNSGEAVLERASSAMNSSGTLRLGSLDRCTAAGSVSSSLSCCTAAASANKSACLVPYRLPELKLLLAVPVVLDRWQWLLDWHH